MRKSTKDEEKVSHCSCGHCDSFDMDDEDDKTDEDELTAEYTEPTESTEQNKNSKNIINFPVSIPILCVGIMILAAAFVTYFDVRIRIGLSVILYIYFGLPIIIKMVSAFMRGDVWNENTLMTTATLGAFAIGEFADAAAVMLLYSFGEYLHDMAFDKTKKRISDSIIKPPDYANVIRNGRIIKVKPEEVQIGEEIMVKPGEKIPLDGIVTEGGAYADNSAITGESSPVSLVSGSPAVSGGIVSHGAVRILINKKYSESAVSLVAKALKEAGKRKSPTEKAITKFSKVYTPAVFCIAVIVVMTNIFLLNGQTADSVKIGLIFLVISCPCALVLSVPLTYFAGLGAASKKGILIKGGESIDNAAAVGSVVFDKTGTVTKSDISVSGVYAVNNYDMGKIYAVMQNSNHPLCNTFVKQFNNQYKNNITVINFEEIPGKGITADADGAKIICGNFKFLRENKIDPEEIKGTAIYFAENGIYKGSVLFTDTLKDGAYGLVEDLRKLGVNSDKIYLMSGDNFDAVAEISGRLKIKNFFHNLQPHEKMEQLENLIHSNKSIKSGKSGGKNNKYKKIMFVGDGLNDSAVIARADVGIAVQKPNANGAYSAVNAADMVILDDKIEKTANIIKISKAVKSVVIQNITFALTFKLAIMLFTAFVYSSMELAIIADVGAALLCVLNSLRVLRIT